MFKKCDTEMEKAIKSHERRTLISTLKVFMSVSITVIILISLCCYAVKDSSDIDVFEFLSWSIVLGAIATILIIFFMIFTTLIKKHDYMEGICIDKIESISRDFDSGGSSSITKYLIKGEDNNEYECYILYSSSDDYLNKEAYIIRKANKIYNISYDCILKEDLYK